MKRVQFNKPGRYIARNMVDLYEVEDVERVYEVDDDFVDFNAGLVTCVDAEPEQKTLSQEEIDALKASITGDSPPGEDDGAEDESPPAEGEDGDKLKNRRRSRARKDDGAELLG